MPGTPQHPQKGLELPARWFALGNYMLSTVPRKGLEAPRKL